MRWGPRRRARFRRAADHADDGGVGAAHPSGQAGAQHDDEHDAARHGPRLDDVRRLDRPDRRRRSAPGAAAAAGHRTNVVITEWDWADPKAYLHDEVSTDRRNPTLNPNGLIYGALELSADYLPVSIPCDTRSAASR